MRRLALILLLPLTVMLSGCPAAVVGGVAAGVVVAQDRRTLATITEDEAIEMKTRSRVSERHKDNVNLSVVSYNRMVLLLGQAPSEEVRRDIERIARSVENVRGVTNEMAIGPTSTLSSRANDAFVTSKVKARFVDAQRFNSVHVKVVTVSQVAYLLGLVTRQEAKDAIAITRTTEGVKKVVTMFEYID